MTITVTAILTIITISLWATALLPEFVTALLFITSALILKITSPEIILSGFQSEAFWLVLSGFVVGGAIRKVGLADRAANLILTRMTRSWFLLVFYVVALTYALAFVMPSNMGRITLLMPVIMSVADKVGLERGSKGRTGLALGVGFGTFQLSSSILPANVPNLVLAGAAQANLGIRFNYLDYLLLHAPVLGVLKGVVLVVAISILFPAQIALPDRVERPSRLRGPEIRLMLLLAATLLLWMTDQWHGIATAWIGLAAACVCVLPRIGFLSGEEFSSNVNLRTCIYIAGILALSSVVSASGLAALIGQGLIALFRFDPAASFRNFGSLLAISTTLNFVVTSMGVPALYTPVARGLADATNFPTVGVLMIQVIGYSTPLIPYQAAPIVVAMSMAKIKNRDATKLCLWVAAATALMLVPLDYMWFQFLGVLTNSH